MVFFMGPQAMMRQTHTSAKDTMRQYILPNHSKSWCFSEAEVGTHARSGTQHGEEAELGNLHLLQHDALGHGGATEGVGLHRRDRVGLVVVLARQGNQVDNREHTPRGGRAGREVQVTLCEKGGSRSGFGEKYRYVGGDGERCARGWKK